jgi:hypothetical protein
VFATLDFYDDAESPPRRLIADSLALLEGIFTWARVPAATRDRTRESISLIRDKLAGWTAMPEEFRPREQPKVAFIATCPALGNQAPRSALDQVAEKWGSRSVSELTVVTPFVGKPHGDQDTVVQRLTTIPRTRERVGWLVALLLQIVQKVLEQQGLEQFGATVGKALQNYQAPRAQPSSKRLARATNSQALVG